MAGKTQVAIFPFWCVIFFFFKLMLCVSELCGFFRTIKKFRVVFIGF